MNHIGHAEGSQSSGRTLARLVFFTFLVTFVVARILVFLMMSQKLPDLFLHLGGTHVHHLNYGIFLLCGVGAYLLFARPAGGRLRAAAVVYAIGLALTFDEFGMWLHLGGSYWQRASYDAVAVIMGTLGFIAFSRPERPCVNGTGGKPLRWYYRVSCSSPCCQIPFVMRARNWIQEWSRSSRKDPSSMIHHRPHQLAAGVRGVALFEATKGLVVILAGFGLLSLVHHDLQAVAEQIVGRLHLNPARHTARIFLETAADLSDTRMRLLALLALLYSAMRLVEAYGLWVGRRWAEWFAVISGGIYVPLEIVELSRGFAWLKLAALVLNLAVVLYLGYVLARERRRLGRPAGE